MSTAEFPIGDTRARYYRPEIIENHLPVDWRVSIIDVFHANKILQTIEPNAHWTSREEGLIEPLQEWAVNGEVLAADPRTAWIDRVYKGFFYELALEADSTATLIDDPKRSTRSVGHRGSQRGEAHVDFSPVALNLYVDLPWQRRLKPISEEEIQQTQYGYSIPVIEKLGGGLVVTTNQEAKDPVEIMETGQILDLEVGSVTVLNGNTLPHFALGALPPEGWVNVGRGAMRLMVGFNYLNAEVNTFDNDLLKQAGIIES